MQSGRQVSLSKFKLCLFNDGVGVQIGRLGCTLQLSNISLNLKRMSIVIKTTIFASFAAASAWPNFRMNGTDYYFEAGPYYDDSKNHTDSLGFSIMTKLKGGACNVTKLEDRGSIDFTYCIDFSYNGSAIWLLPLEIYTFPYPTCQDLMPVINCVTRLKDEYIKEHPMPPGPGGENDDSYLYMVIGGAFFGFSALSVIGIFGHKVLQRYKNNRYEKIAISEGYEDPVLLDLMEDPQKLNCGHRVDLKTLEDMKKHELCNCPICNIPITSSQADEAFKNEIQKHESNRRNILTC